MIDFIILAKSDNQQSIDMTQNAIDSITKSLDPKDDFKKGQVIIVESHHCLHNYNNAISILYDARNFNYNHALNIGIDRLMHLNNDKQHWICSMNNDILCDNLWLKEISLAHEVYPDILSFSPKCIKECNEDISIGYTLGKHLQGYCFICNRKVIDEIGGKFDETFDFYFQDDDYLEELRKHNIKHACIKKSIVNHLGQQTTGKEDIRKLFEDRDKFIRKWSLQTYLLREYEKQII